MSDLRDILTTIYQQRGELTPANVVAEARDEAHPLHHRFEWDDTIAGEKYREIQAGALIRSVKITYTAKSGEQSVRGFLPIVREENAEVAAPTTTYKPTEEVVADPFTRELVLREFKREWQRFQERYKHLAEFAEIITNDIKGQAA